MFTALWERYGKLVRVSFSDMLLLFTLVLVFLSLLIASIQSYNSTVKYVTDKVEGANISSLSQTGQMIEDNLSQISSITRNIANNPTIKYNLQNYGESSDYSKLDMSKEIESILNKMQRFNTNIASIVVFSKDSVFYTGNILIYNVTQADISESYFGSMLKSVKPGEAFFYEPKIKNKIEIKNRMLDVLSSKFFYAVAIENNGQEYGSVFVVLSPEIFHNQLKNNKNIILYDSEYSVLWSSNIITENEMGYLIKKMSAFNNNGLQKVTTNQITAYIDHNYYNNWNMAYVYKNDVIYEKVKLLKTFFVITFIITSVFALVISRILSKKIVKPFKKLLNLIQSYKVKSKEMKFFNYYDNSRITMRESILYYIIGVVILPVAIYAISSYYYSSKVIKDYIIESNLIAFKQAAENINNYFDNKLKMIRNIIYDDTVQKSLVDNTYDSVQHIGYMVENNLLLHEGRDEIFIYDKQGSLFFTNSSFLSNTTLKDKKLYNLKSSKDSVDWQDTLSDSHKRNLFDMYMRITDINKLNTIGYIQCQSLENSLENIYKSVIKEKINIFIVNKNGTVISHSDKKRIGTETGIDCTDYYNSKYIYTDNSIVFVRQIRNTPWNLVGIYPDSIFEEDMKQLLYKKIYIFLAIFLSTIIIAILMSFNFTAFINRIIRRMKLLDIDNMDIYFPDNSNINEVTELGMAFNDMILRLEYMVDQLLIATKKQKELEDKKKEAEIVALQAQINPHFLYNTFESINWMIELDNKTGATKMINDLSSLLRYSAKSGEPIALLSEEIQHVRHYTDIMAMRFQDKICFSWDIDEALLNRKSLKLLLQPIVENAIYHGISPKLCGGCIKIGCHERSRRIILTVEDNGVGITESKVQTLNENLNNTEEHCNSIGLYNVQNRVKLFFGNDYGVFINSKEGRRTKVEIHIPSNV